MGRNEVWPIYLGEVRKARLSLHIRCPRCQHHAEIPAMEMPLPDDLDMNQVGHRLKCTRCRRRGGHSVYPDHQPWVRYLRKSGQPNRLPWFAPMIRDEQA